ncbi:MAG: molybdopterin-dependent oxidoreductase, partial [Bacteroidia bacterium]|nr:molybdopterin-dependent oxidoreductase [Bacteroidia bacterium]
LRIIPLYVRLKHWRAVGHGPNKFAIECMIDEVASDHQIDPVEYRRRLMRNAPRALATLNKAAEMANWNTDLPAGRAQGVAFLERSGTLSSGICEISLDRGTGKIRVHHFWSANDAGIVIQPDNVKAQIEGGIIMGMSSVFKEKITIQDGQVQQSNFHDYPILRYEDIPESIETAIIDSRESPQGVGESGTPLVAGAVANAFYALTGKKLRHLPFTPERVLEALEV